MKASALAFGVLDRDVYQVGILRFVRRSEEQGWVCRSILETKIFKNAMAFKYCCYLWFVHANGYSAGISILSGIGAVKTHTRNRQCLRQQSCPSA